MNFDPSKDYYQVLGADRNATKIQIEALYNAATDKNDEVQEAYRVLSSDTMRKAYNEWTAPSDSEDNSIFDEAEQIVTNDQTDEVQVSATEETQTPSNGRILEFAKKWVTCLILLVLGPIYCIASILFGFGGSLGTTLLFAFIPIAIVWLVYFLRNGQNKKRTTAIAGIIIAIVVAIILVLQAVFAPVIKGPQDIINSINSSAGNVLTIQKALDVTNDAPEISLTVIPTSKSVNETDLCTTVMGIMHKSENKVWLDNVENWVSNADFNVIVWWNVDGRSVRIDPGMSKDFSSTKVVKLESIHTVQSGQTTEYNCS